VNETLHPFQFAGQIEPISARKAEISVFNNLSVRCLAQMGSFRKDSNSQGTRPCLL
jgi:hypothetical protein